jgi:hypothetical protein
LDFAQRFFKVLEFARVAGPHAALKAAAAIWWEGVSLAAKLMFGRGTQAGAVGAVKPARELAPDPLFRRALGKLSSSRGTAARRATASWPRASRRTRLCFARGTVPLFLTPSLEARVAVDGQGVDRWEVAIDWETPLDGALTAPDFVERLREIREFEFVEPGVREE